ncbi:phospholipid methyltransferase-domain-containing protein [Globomyces pollinis-pini]|nr:phospholipid methyltransferase-domain-containing protein [Globomyces pollinis-pini]
MSVNDSSIQPQYQEGRRYKDDSVFYFPSDLAGFPLFWGDKLAACEYATAACCLIQLFIGYNADTWLLLAWFLFWRVLSLVSLGWLLTLQSTNSTIVTFLATYGLGRNPKSPRSPWTCYWINQVNIYMSRNTGADYHYDTLPLEFNSWILFRQLAFFLLTNDTLSYILLVRSCGSFEFNSFRSCTMFVGGFLLVLLNIWIRIDIAQTVEPYTQYWGSFFFYMDTSKSDTDSFYGRIPHPMYSVGYIGYYGMALITQSYIVLFASLASHIAQIAFLYIIERPHAKKINKRYTDHSNMNHLTLDQYDHDKEYARLLHLYFDHGMIVFKNINIFRTGDLLTLFIVFYTLFSSFSVGPINSTYTYIYYIGQPIFWRIIHTYGLGAILHLQKTNKFWTRRFIRHGEGLREAFHHWKILFNLTLTMSYVSFVICSYRCYFLPSDFGTDGILLRHTIGILFIALHCWITVSVYQVIGPLGWFHGDYFIESLQFRYKMKRTGIYKYLDHPLLFTFSCWGMVLICSSWSLLWITVFGQVSHGLFFWFVEQPHLKSLASNIEYTEPQPLQAINSMPKNDSFETLYSTELNHRKSRSRVSSVMESLSDSYASSDNPNQSYNPSPSPGTNSPLSTGYVRETLKLVVQELEDMLDTAKPHVQAMVQKTQRGVVNLANAARLEESLPPSELPLHLYSLTFTKPADDSGIVRYQIGEPIEIQFTGCRERMKRKDWIGIYAIDQNFDTNITTSSCKTRWRYASGGSKFIPTSIITTDDTTLFSKSTTGTRMFGETPIILRPSSESGLRVVQGTLLFSKQQVPWELGTYTFRYHHDGKYNVLAISKPFEIVLTVPEHINPYMNVLETLKPVIERCLDLTTDDEPLEVTEGMLERLLVPTGLIQSGNFFSITIVPLLKYRTQVAKRIVYCVFVLYRVEFSTSAIESMYSIEMLAERIQNAQKLLGNSL